MNIFWYLALRTSKQARRFSAAARQPHEPGPAALQRVQGLLSALTLLNLPANPGPTERMCSIPQGQLTEERVRSAAGSCPRTPLRTRRMMRSAPRRTRPLRRLRAITVTRFPPMPATPGLPRARNIAAPSSATSPQAALRRPAPLRLPAALPMAGHPRPPPP